MTPLCQITRNGGCPSRTAGKIKKSPTGCADRYSSNNCVPAFGGTAFIWVQRGHSLPLFPLPLPLSLEGFPKGRNRSFAPLCRFKGVRGEIEIPPRFSLGGWGDILFSKENIPFGFSPRKPGPPFAPKTPSPCPDMGMSPCWSKSSPVPHSGTLMKYPPDPKILLRFPRYGPSGPEGYPPAGGRTPPPFAPHPPA